jgi:hypothetical protein
MMCERLAANRKACNCSYEPCSRKGNCCACIAYHRASDELPACYFDAKTEASYDRSVGRFLRMRGSHA